MYKKITGILLFLATTLTVIAGDMPNKPIKGDDSKTREQKLHCYLEKSVSKIKECCIEIENIKKEIELLHEEASKKLRELDIVKTTPLYDEECRPEAQQAIEFALEELNKEIATKNSAQERLQEYLKELQMYVAKTLVLIKRS
jgi:hypothetical protein